MRAIVDNWALLLAAVAIIGWGISGIYSFVNLPTASQIVKVSEWCVWIVTQAEIELGSGTGKLKMRWVYDKFLVTFPWLAKVITFDMFQSIVEQALEEAKLIWRTNENVKKLMETPNEDI